MLSTTDQSMYSLKPNTHVMKRMARNGSKCEQFVREKSHRLSFR